MKIMKNILGFAGLFGLIALSCYGEVIETAATTFSNSVVISNKLYLAGYGTNGNEAVTVDQLAKSLGQMGTFYLGAITTNVVGTGYITRLSPYTNATLTVNGVVSNQYLGYWVVPLGDIGTLNSSEAILKLYASFNSGGSRAAKLKGEVYILRATGMPEWGEAGGIATVPTSVGLIQSYVYIPNATNLNSASEYVVFAIKMAVGTLNNPNITLYFGSNYNSSVTFNYSGGRGSEVTLGDLTETISQLSNNVITVVNNSNATITTFTTNTFLPLDGSLAMRGTLNGGTNSTTNWTYVSGQTLYEGRYGLEINGDLMITGEATTAFSDSTTGIWTYAGIHSNCPYWTRTVNATTYYLNYAPIYRGYYTIGDSLDEEMTLVSFNYGGGIGTNYLGSYNPAGAASGNPIASNDFTAMWTYNTLSNRYAPKGWTTNISIITTSLTYVVNPVDGYQITTNTFSFTRDSDYHNMDVSAYIDSGAISIDTYVAAVSTGANTTLSLFTTHSNSCGQCRVYVASQYGSISCRVPLDNGVILYKDNLLGPGPSEKIQIIGWTLPVVHTNQITIILP